MKQSTQPFTEHVTRSQSDRGRTKLAWSLAAAFALLSTGLFFLWAKAKAEAEQVGQLQTRLQEAADSLTAAKEEEKTTQETMAALKLQMADLEREKEQASNLAKGLEDEMRTALESRDVTISELQGKLTLNILDHVMFDSGEAILKTDGQAVLRKVAEFLASHPGLKIHVIGHTDNLPIRSDSRSRFASNWELSSARALAAVHFLTEQAGFDPQRVGAVAYGEQRPIADNLTAEGRAKNRRIEIGILPDEHAAADPGLIPTKAP